MIASSLLPHKIESETSLLCACLMDRKISEEVIESLSADDFYHPKHQMLFQAIRDVCREDPEKVTVITVIERLREKGQLEKAGGSDYLLSLPEAIFTTAAWKFEMSMVKDASDRRRLIHALHDAIEKSGKPTTHALPDILSSLNQTLGEISPESKIAPLSPSVTSICNFIEIEPPPRKYIFADLLPEKIVGGVIATGGTGKGFLEIALSIGMASGRTVLRHFKPTRSFDVLGLFAEDDDDELHRRVHFTAKRIFPNLDMDTRMLLEKNLHMKSLIGIAQPLMKLEGGNPARTEFYAWLRKTIEAHQGLEVLILDPKSRFYGLDENSNDHNTQWVSCLESLSQEFNLTILFAHHTNKTLSGSLNQNAARGGSGLVDGCRWSLNLRVMDEATAKKYEIENPKMFLECAIPKNNYAPELPQTLFFKRGDHGVLLPVDLKFHRIKDMAEHLCCLLHEHEPPLSRRELISQPAGKEIRDQMKERFGKCIREDVSRAIEFALQDGMLSESSLSSSTRSKGILTVERMPA